MAPSTPRWVKLRSMQTPWPACVYEDYSAAARCMHEVGELRAAKPVLDVEDRVVFFFGVGVGARAVRARGTGVAPNLQLCVAHVDDLADAAFSGQLGFAPLCRALGLREDVILRTEMSSVFRRACAEAEKLVASVETEEQATQVFVDMIRDDTASSAGRKTALDEAMEDEEPIPTKKIASKPFASSKSVAKPVKAPPAPRSQNEASLAEVLASPKLEGLTAKCWEMMLDAGWEVMAQANGEQLYKMPGVSFFEFQPNVNIFDSRDKACAQFLKSWIQSAAQASGKESNQTDLVEFVWPLMVEAGWQTMTSTNETWFIMPNTPFDKCVPNATIFSGKEQAVAKFLEHSGLGAPIALPASQHPEEPEDDSDAVTNDGTEDLEEAEQEDNSQESSSQVEPVVDSNNNKEHGEHEESDSSDEEDSEEIAVLDLTKAPRPAKLRASHTSKIRNTGNPKAKRFIALSPEKSQSSQPTVATAPPKVNARPAIPPFKLMFGRVEKELKSRGWFWRDSPLGFKYYQPHCADQQDSELTLDKDYFYGQDGVESFLHRTGLIDDIQDTLYREHVRKHRSDVDDSGDEGDQHSRPAASKTFAPQRQVVKTNSTSSREDKWSSTRTSRLVTHHSLSKRRLPEQGRSTRKRPRSSTQTDEWEPKFGDIWAKLEEEGWHFKSSALEYDYFKPHCNSVKDGKMDVDYFPSKMHLQEYLHQSGIWHRVSAELKIEVEMDDEDESFSDTNAEEDAPNADVEVLEHSTASQDDNAAHQRSRKRKSGSGEPENVFDFDFEAESFSKKQRNSSEFRTPVAAKKPLAPSTKFTTVNTPAHDDTISPDAAGLKESDHASAPTSALPRNLASIFTPSPNIPKKVKPSEKHASEVTKSPVTETDALSAAIKRLTASYTPRRFRYRESEFAEIRGFFRQCFMQRRGASLYISGAPGCGKTALLKSTEGDIDELHKECFQNRNARLVRLHVNAMSIKDTGALLCELAEAATKRSFSDPEDAFDAVEAATSTASSSKRHTTLVLVLDEMDTLLSRNGVESDLCRLFELAHHPSHAFVLIGIANQVDFTERHLPLLKERLPNCRPRVLVFKAYSHETIEQILVDRLGGKQEAIKMLNAHGITFLARKIASTTGDIRLALDTCRRILQHRTQDKENADSQRPMALTDMLRQIKHALESKSSAIVQSLPRNLQMILFASTRLVGSQPGALVGVDELYASYRDVCDTAGVLSPLSEREFRSSLDILSAESLLAPAELKRQLVKPSFSASELLQGFRADAYFSRLI